MNNGIPKPGDFGYVVGVAEVARLRVFAALQTRSLATLAT